LINRIHRVKRPLCFSTNIWDDRFADVKRLDSDKISGIVLAVKEAIILIHQYFLTSTGAHITSCPIRTELPSSGINHPDYALYQVLVCLATGPEPLPKFWRETVQEKL
jgi:hypothetical protein